MAPGIAEALIATALGLAAAIPAVISAAETFPNDMSAVGLPATKPRISNMYAGNTAVIQATPSMLNKMWK